MTHPPSSKLLLREQFGSTMVSSRCELPLVAIVALTVASFCAGAFTAWRLALRSSFDKGINQNLVQNPPSSSTSGDSVGSTGASAENRESTPASSAAEAPSQTKDSTESEAEDQRVRVQDAAQDAPARLGHHRRRASRASRLRIVF